MQLLENQVDQKSMNKTWKYKSFQIYYKTEFFFQIQSKRSKERNWKELVIYLDKKIGTLQVENM